MPTNRPERLSSLTQCGLPGIAQIPYGVHMCRFFEGRDDLAETLVPYFAAGLQGNERCIWITAKPLEAADARRALAAAGVDVEAAIARGALVVRDYSDWYAQSGALKGNEVVDLWLAAEQQALAQGYAGLRITGNVTFLRSPQDWATFMEYEALVDRAFRGRRIVTLCTYHAGCGASEHMEVVHRHTCTLDRPDDGWQILTGQPG